MRRLVRIVRAGRVDASGLPGESHLEGPAAGGTDARDMKGSASERPERHPHRHDEANMSVLGQRSLEPTDTTVEHRSAPLPSEQAAVTTRRHLAAAVAALRAMDPAAPWASRDEALAELLAAAREQNAYLHAVAHDLRNPLTALRGQTQLLRRRVRRADLASIEAARFEEGMARIEDATERTVQLIDSLLDAGWPVEERSETAEAITGDQSAITQSGSAATAP